MAVAPCGTTVAPRAMTVGCHPHYSCDIGMGLSGSRTWFLGRSAGVADIAPPPSPRVPAPAPGDAPSLDTGRLNPETYRLFDAVEKHYGIHIEYTFPDQQEVVDLVRAKGLFSFYNDGHQECCRVRK
eukprot:364208-Chlamydomonas_euryale.AAC.43